MSRWMARSWSAMSSARALKRSSMTGLLKTGGFFRIAIQAASRSPFLADPADDGADGLGPGRQVGGEARSDFTHADRIGGAARGGIFRLFRSLGQQFLELFDLLQGQGVGFELG